MFSHTYRPGSLSEIVGQDHIINEMKRRSFLMDFPQAMLFSGPTGTGKTTLCHMLSALINCSSPQKEKDVEENEFMSPCLDCASCRSVINQRFDRDISVFNASTLGKASVERLDELVSLSPFYDKNKIVIIEEFQEFFSSRSYGPLLTLLEGLTKGVYFFLIGMDISKVSEAIQDRCAYYRFMPVPVPEIVVYLHRVLEKAALTSAVPDHFIAEGLTLIAERANGSVRRAVRDLEMCISGESYSRHSIETILAY